MAGFDDAGAHSMTHHAFCALRALAMEVACCLRSAAGHQRCVFFGFSNPSRFLCFPPLFLMLSDFAEDFIGIAMCRPKPAVSRLLRP